MMKKPNNWWQKTKAGETLLEVMIAIVVVMIGSATATSLIISAIKANVFNKDLLTALNLAQEGIEYMRNVRDTNWIKFSSDTQSCWNMRPEAATCAVGNVIATNDAGSASGYALGSTLSTKIASKLELNDGVAGVESGYLMSYWDKDNTYNSDGLGTVSDDLDIAGSGLVAPYVKVKDTYYYRAIYVDYKKIATTTPWGLTDPAAPEETNGDMMQVTTVVQWMDGPTRHQISLTSALTRYK